MRENGSLLKLVIVVAFVALTAIAAADPYVCGDADDSGGIDIDDVVFLINHIFSGGPAPDPGCCASDCPPTVTDYDGNTYSVVQIGCQCWMAENLKVTHYRNGDPIPLVTDPGAWLMTGDGAYCNYDNDPSNVEIYGRLYNWQAVYDVRNIAPEGWHVATDAEWKQLEMHLGMDPLEVEVVGWRGTDEGGKLKEAGTIHWNSPNTGATNESGFTALPGGYRDWNGGFVGMGAYGDFWCPNHGETYQAWYRGLSSNNSLVSRKEYDDRAGFSVRCVKD